MPRKRNATSLSREHGSARLSLSTATLLVICLDGPNPRLRQIHRAAQHPIALDGNAVAAIETRILLDLRIGAVFTRMQSLKIQAALGRDKNVVSYGPCQFPTLGFVVARYQDVQNFQPEKFWYIHLTYTQRSQSQGSFETTFTWRRGHIFDEEVAAECYEHVMDSPVAVVEKVINKSTKKWFVPVCSALRVGAHDIQETIAIDYGRAPESWVAPSSDEPEKNP